MLSLSYHNGLYNSDVRHVRRQQKDNSSVQVKYLSVLLNSPFLKEYVQEFPEVRQNLLLTL